MCPVPTESSSIGYLTESTWIPESKSNTLIPKTNSPTFRRKAQHHERFHVLLQPFEESFFQKIKPCPRSRWRKRKTRRRRWARGCQLETCATCSLYDTASVCNSAEFELISKPGEHDSKVFKTSVSRRFHRIGSYCFGCRFALARYSLLLIYGMLR